MSLNRIVMRTWAALLLAAGPVAAADPLPRLIDFDFEFRPDKPAVGPGQTVRLIGRVPVAWDVHVVVYSVSLERIGTWDPRIGRMVGTVYPDVGAGAFGKATFGGDLDFDANDARYVGKAAEYRADKLGVYLAWCEWDIESAKRIPRRVAAPPLFGCMLNRDDPVFKRTIASPPTIFVVRPPVGKDGKAVVKPEWLDRTAEQLDDLPLVRRHPIGFVAALDKAVITLGTTAQLAAPGHLTCVDAHRVGRLNAELGGLVAVDHPETADPTADLGLALEPLTAPGRRTTWNLRPKRPGIYLVTATRLEADGRTRTTSQPILLAVRPPAGKAGKVVVKPEWLPPPLVRDRFGNLPLDLDPGCERRVGLPPRE